MNFLALYINAQTQMRYEQKFQSLRGSTINLCIFGH